jgi:hypothetical protein
MVSFEFLLAEQADAVGARRPTSGPSTASSALNDRSIPCYERADGTEKNMTDATGSAMDSDWEKAYREFDVSRMTRVQNSAQSWLAGLTSLLGLFSAGVFLNSGSTITDLPSKKSRLYGLPIEKAVFWLAGTLFLLAFLAILSTAFATWGGLGAVDNLSDYEKKCVNNATWCRRWLHTARFLGLFCSLLIGFAALAVLYIRAFPPG